MEFLQKRERRFSQHCTNLLMSQCFKQMFQDVKDNINKENAV